MKIEYITHKNIDKTKWDICINNSINKLIYAYSWYLEITAVKFDALILDDYEAVMPIISNKKYFLNYIYQPYFTQQLGIFYQNNIDEIIINEFIKNIPSKFKHISINFNSFCFTKSYNFQNKINYILNLSSEYDSVRKNYSKRAKTWVNKSLKHNFEIKEFTDEKLYINLKKQYSNYNLTNFAYNKLEILIKTILKNKLGFLRGIYKENKIISAIFIIDYNNRLYFINSFNNEIAKQTGASFLLIDSIFKEYSNKNYIFDFEGSNIPSIEYFFQGWGATRQDYFNLSVFKLPKFLKYFMK